MRDILNLINELCGLWYDHNGIVVVDYPFILIGLREKILESQRAYRDNAFQSLRSHRAHPSLFFDDYHMIVRLLGISELPLGFGSVQI